MEKVGEARLQAGDAGVGPASDGWFIVNVAEAEGMRSERFGAGVRFESMAQPFPEFGINVRVLEPGQPACLYHREDAQEAFLVLSGECVAVVEDEERQLRKGDFLYCPPWTAHVIAGAGTGPSSVLMAGTRKAEDRVHYPVSEVAARYGASVAEPTDDPLVAYAGATREPATVPLPW